MPRGPRGFPRLTSIGPFVEEEAEQEFTVEEKTVLSAPVNDFYRVLSQAGVIEQKMHKNIEMKLVLREPLPEGEGGILDNIQRSIGEITRDVTVSRGSYQLFEEDGVATVGFIETQDQFRGEGIATELKERMIEHMDDHGVRVAYTKVISGPGRSLAERTGFVEENEVFPDEPRILVRRF